jgi:hypothetical protein
MRILPPHHASSPPSAWRIEGLTLRLLAFLAILVAASPAQAKGWCDGSIRGRVFEDVNYGGGLGRDRSEAQADAPGFSIARPMAVVELYDSSGRFVADQITKSDGSYEFKNVDDGTYTVRVVNDTVRSSRPGSTGALRAVQTFRVDGKGEAGGTGRRRVGGERPQLVDAPARTHGQKLSDLQSLPGKYTQSIVRIRVDNATVKNVDFGFNFDTIVNTNDAGQGSLRQFILNANTLRNTGLDQDDAPDGAGMVPKTPGFEHTIFMIPTSDVRWTGNSGDDAPDGGTGDVFVIELASALPRIEGDAKTAIDGRTQTAYTGDTKRQIPGRAFSSDAPRHPGQGSSPWQRALPDRRAKPPHPGPGPGQSIFFRGGSPGSPRWRARVLRRASRPVAIR